MAYLFLCTHAAGACVDNPVTQRSSKGPQAKKTLAKAGVVEAMSDACPEFAPYMVRSITPRGGVGLGRGRVALIQHVP